MDPSYQPGQLPTPTPQSNQYDFITNPQKPPRRGIKGFGKGGRSNLLIMIAVGLVAVTIILIIISLIFGGESNKDVLLGVARKQSQVIAVAEEGADKGGSQQTKSLALAVKLAVTSQQQALLKKIQKDGKVKEKEYKSAPSSKVIQQLASAEKNGRFDEAFNNVIENELTAYQQELKQANAAISSKSTKEQLATDFNNVGLLLKIPDSN